MRKAAFFCDRAQSLDYVYDQGRRKQVAGRPLKYQVTLEMLETMA